MKMRITSRTATTARPRRREHVKEGKQYWQILQADEAITKISNDKQMTRAASATTWLRRREEVNAARSIDSSSHRMRSLRKKEMTSGVAATSRLRKDAQVK